MHPLVMSPFSRDLINTSRLIKVFTVFNNAINLYNIYTVPGFSMVEHQYFLLTWYWPVTINKMAKLNGLFSTNKIANQETLQFDDQQINKIIFNIYYIYSTYYHNFNTDTYIHNHTYNTNTHNTQHKHTQHKHTHIYKVSNPLYSMASKPEESLINITSK